MLLVSISGRELDPSLWYCTITMLLLSVVYFVFAGLAAAAAVPLFHIRQRPDCGVYKAIFTSTNAGFFGFPVTLMVFGEEALYYMALLNIVMNLYLYGVCPVQLGGVTMREAVRAGNLSKLLNPCIVSALVSIALLFAHIHLPDFLTGVIGPIGDATIPMAMLLIGMQLADSDLKSGFLNMNLSLFSAVRMILWPAVILACLHWVPVSEEIRLVLVLGAALPPASTISVLAADAGGNHELTANGIVITTILSIVSIPLSVLMLEML